MQKPCGGHGFCVAEALACDVAQAIGRSLTFHLGCFLLGLRREFCVEFMRRGWIGLLAAADPHCFCQHQGCRYHGRAGIQSHIAPASGAAWNAHLVQLIGGRHEEGEEHGEAGPFRRATRGAAPECCPSAELSSRGAASSSRAAATASKSTAARSPACARSCASPG